MIGVVFVATAVGLSNIPRILAEMVSASGTGGTDHSGKVRSTKTYPPAPLRKGKASIKQGRLNPCESVKPPGAMAKESCEGPVRLSAPIPGPARRRANPRRASWPLHWLGIPWRRVTTAHRTSHVLGHRRGP